MTAGFEPPAGDPALIDLALTSLGGVVTDLTRQERHLEHGVQQARSTWKAPREHDFARAGTGLLTQAGSARTSLDGAIAAVGHYAQALRTARGDIADLGRQAQSRLDSADDTVEGLDDPDGTQAIQARQHADQFVSGLQQQAAGIRSRLDQLAEEAAQALDQATGAVVPGGAELTPEDLRARVTEAYGVGMTRAALAGAMLTADGAWAALDAAQVSAPPADWRTWAAAYGLEVPEHLDTTRGLAVKAQLEQVLADSLSVPPEERAEFLHDHFVMQDGERISDSDLLNLAMIDPALVGNLDGLPNDVRYTANKVNVFHAVASEQALLDAWQPPPTEQDQEYVGYVRLQGRIDMLTKVLEDASLTRNDDGTDPKQVLVFAPPQYDGFRVVDDGRLALTVGDLDHADHVGIVVPGITNRIDNFGATFDKALNTQYVAGDDTATVAWLGYDTPELHDAVTDEDALEGGEALHDFLAGIQRAEGSDLTVMAHSYGTLVTSKALQLGKDLPPIPDRIVLFGSPGLGENVHSTADLGLPPGYPIYALRAPGDPVSITAGVGHRPDRPRGHHPARHRLARRRGRARALGVHRPRLGQPGQHRRRARRHPGRPARGRGQRARGRRRAPGPLQHQPAQPRRRAPGAGAGRCAVRLRAAHRGRARAARRDRVADAELT